MKVLMSGTAHGIGAACAARLRADGADVDGFDIDATGAFRLDLSDPAAVATAPLAASYDAMVHAAGLPPRPGQAAAILGVNFLGIRQLTERALPGMAPGGAIAFVASKAAGRWRENLPQVLRFMALPDDADLDRFVADEGIDPVRAYDLSKEALVVWTRANTARLMRLGLRANTISPAPVESRILDDFVAAFGDRATKAFALTDRFGTPDEIAEVAAFLVSPASSWIRSTDIVTDGGLMARMDCAALGIDEAS